MIWSVGCEAEQAGRQMAGANNTPPMRAAASWLSAVAGRTTVPAAAFPCPTPPPPTGRTQLPSFPGHLRHESQHAKGRGEALDCLDTKTIFEFAK